MKRVFALILAAALLTGCSATTEVVSCYAEGPTLGSPAYPQMAPYPDEMAYIDSETGEFDDTGFHEVYSAWAKDLRKQRDQPDGYADNLSEYFLRSIPELLGTGNGNAVCSPLNVYMALSMLAECTGGDSQKQILELLWADSIIDLRTQAGQVWNAHYCVNGSTDLILANSLWLDEGMTYNSDTVATLANSYYASVYQGDLGTSDMNDALRSWLNEQTDGLLQEQAQNIEMKPETVLAQASAIRYRVKWNTEFQEARNTEGAFHSPGGDRDVTYMNTTLSYGPYYWGEDFAATFLDLEDGGRMWLLLPDEGTTPGDLLQSRTALDMILNFPDRYENQKDIQVNLSIPKFDIAADLELSEVLSNLGVTEVFGENADFSTILPDSFAYLDSVRHAARVAIDEEGVTAAAYTVMMECGAAEPPKDTVNLILDRPFLFVITSHDDLPLFAGVVSEP